MNYSDYDRSERYRIDLNMNNIKDARVIASNYIKPNTKILDVGCACGDFGSFIKKEKNCIVYGMEYNRWSIAIAKQTKAYEEIHQVDLNYFNENNYTNYSNYFDYIILLDVLEHLFYPEKVLTTFSKFLNANGVFIVSLPNVAYGEIKVGLLRDEFYYTKMGILDETHLRFFTYKSIIDLCTDNNLEIIDCSFKIEYCKTPIKDLPRQINKYIMKDPHSYVYQYVLKIVPSKKDNLQYINTAKMQIRWSFLKNELRALEIEKLKQLLLPGGSLRLKIAKKIKKYLIMKSKNNEK